MTKYDKLMIELNNELDEIGEKIKKENITDKEILDSYNRIRRLLK